MGVSKMIELLQIKERGKIVLVKLGGFYIAGGKDAVLLNSICPPFIFILVIYEIVALFFSFFTVCISN